MRRFAFPARLAPAVEWAPDETGYVVSFRDLPEAITQGEDVADALRQAADCLEEALAARIADDMAIPAPSRPARGERTVEPGGLIAAKAALHLALREAGLSKSDLARKLGCDEKEARRLLDPRHRSRFDRLEAALAALGRRLVVDVRPAA